MQNRLSLTILEEFLLLALDDQTGNFYPVARSALDCATATAVLMGLMAQRRLDCDARHVFVVNPEPTGDDLLDSVLRALALDPVSSTRSIFDEVQFLADEGEAFRDRAMQRLSDRGLVKEEEQKILWIFGSRRFSIQDDRELRAVKLRVVSTVLGEFIPHPHDTALVSLAAACGLFRYLLSSRELAASEARIAQIARLDIFGHTAAEAIAEVEASIAMASGLR